MDSIIDLYRKQVVTAVLETKTVKNCWPIWTKKFSEIINLESPNSDDILKLGDNLTEIFTTTTKEGRGQGVLSAGGTAWEALVCWYLNLCFANSRCIAIKKMSLVPEPIRDSITVNYGNFKSNTESDITIIVFPKTDVFINSFDELSSKNLWNIRSNKSLINLLGKLVSENFNEIEIGIIQCKTNWNDNSQIPMLWDMIYSAGGFRGRNITVGRNGYDIHKSKNFTYAFVTVPTNQKTNFKPDSVAVKRVNNLSGGNFWGKPTKEGVARSVKEIFTNNYISGFDKDLRLSITNTIKNLDNKFSYFNLKV